MRRLMTFFRLPLCLAACALGLASCDETQEASAYDNWQARNEAFVDSLRTVAGDNFLTWQNPPTRAITDIGTDGMELGKLYALLVQDGGNTGGQQYVYCKKLVDNPDGERVLYTDQVSIYYYGTLINNVSFDGNFDGWGATDVLEPEGDAAGIGSGGAYALAAAFLDGGAPLAYALAGYRLKNTLSENGGVSRGICEGDDALNLLGIQEYTGIRREPDGKITSNEKRVFGGEEFTSLNFWAFSSDFMELLGTYFDAFLSQNSRSEKAEFYLPAAVDKAISEKEAGAKILPTDEKWQGVTYREDMPAVEEFLRVQGRI